MNWKIVLLLTSFCAAAQTADKALAQKAVEAERRGDFPQAITIFQQLIRGGADSPELRSNLGIAYYQSGDIHSALREFRTALSKMPNSTTANLFCGLSLLKLQQPEEALRYLAKADRAQPDDVMTLSAIAQAEVASNKTEAANEVFRRVTRLDRQNAEAWYGLAITDRLLAEARLKSGKQSAGSGSVQQNVRQSQALMEDFQKSVSVAMQLDPGSVRASMILGESFRIAEQYEEAIREYKAATEKAPRLAAAWGGLAAAQSASGDDESALKTAARARELDPHDADTSTLIAAIYVRMGDSAKAEPLIREALHLNPHLSSAHLVLGKIYLSAHQPQKALPEIQAAVQDDLDGSTHYLLATTLRQLGNAGEAAVAMKEYERLHKAHVGSIER
jgi:tetratricopeptide (TPR) repeat protein